MKQWLFTLGLLASLAACVTINIYFPAAAAEKAADKIIDDVWQLKEGEKTDGQPVPKTDDATKPAAVLAPAQ